MYFGAVAETVSVIKCWVNRPPAGRQQHSFSSAQACNMAVLQKLGLFQFKENLGTYTLYDHMLDTIKVKKYTQAIVTNAFVTELHNLLYLSRSRHDKVPKNRLSRTEFLHVIGYLVAKMTIEDASAKKMAAGLFRQLPKDATAQLWQDGINFVMKQAGKDRLVAIEAPASGGEACVGGEDGRMAGEGDRDARLEGGGEEAVQGGETGRT